MSYQGLYVQSLQKRFGQKYVVKNVSLSCKPGEIVGLLGPNGAGKTTCFYIVSGLIPANKGKIYFNHYDITRLPMYKRAALGIGYLPQEASIFRGMNVEQNILCVLELTEKNKKKRYERLEKLLNDFSIQSIRKSPALALSGGERRRVEIARALANNPQIIMLDEPLAGVDPVAVQEIKQLIYQLKYQKIGVVITDNNVRETLKIVDRAYILHEGSVLIEGKTEEIIQNAQVKEVYLGKDFIL